MSQSEVQDQAFWRNWPSIGSTRAGQWLRSTLGRQYQRVEANDIESQVQTEPAVRNRQPQQQELQVRSNTSSNHTSSSDFNANRATNSAEEQQTLSGDHEQQHLLQAESGDQSAGQDQEDGGIRGMLNRFGGRKLQSLNLQGHSGSFQKLSSAGSEQLKLPNTAQCLICFDPLTQEDFKANRAIILQCNCRGDVAYRHRECAEKWAKIKGNNVCDVCKAPIRNIQPPPPPEENTLNMQEDLNSNIENFRNDQLRSIEQTWVTDFNWFDCVRVAWIVMIVCMVSFDFSLQRAVAAGMLTGLLYLSIRYCLVVIYVRQEQWALFNAINSYISSVNNQSRSENEAENNQLRRQPSSEVDNSQTDSAQSSQTSTPRYSYSNTPHRLEANERDPPPQSSGMRV